MGAIASAEECVVSRTAFVSAGVRVRVRVRVCVAVSAAPLCLLSKATRFMNPPRRSSTLLHTLGTLVVVPKVVRVSVVGRESCEPALSLSSLPPPHTTPAGRLTSQARVPSATAPFSESA